MSSRTGTGHTHPHRPTLSARIAVGTGSQRLRLLRASKRALFSGGRIFSASTFIYAPASRAQAVGRCLGAQAGEAHIGDFITLGGFVSLRRSAQTPFKLICEAQP